jgi:hypothetical protein
LSKGLASVKTLTAKEIADKFNLPLATVVKKIAAGVKIEKEHTKSTRQANEIARDHLGERPDYYDKLDKMEKTKVVKEQMVNAAGVTPRVPTQNIRQMVQGARTPPSGRPNINWSYDPYTDKQTMSGSNSAASRYAMDKQRHFDSNKAAYDGYKPITSNAPMKNITSAASDMEAKRQAGISSTKDPEIEKTVSNYRYGVTKSDVTPSGVNNEPTPGSAPKTTTTPGSKVMDTETQKINNVLHGKVQEETTTTGMGGLGFRTGTPAIDDDNGYVSTNALAYDPLNGARLDFIKKIHSKLHNSLGFNEFNPTNKKHSNSELVEKKLNELGEYDNKGGMSGYEGVSGPIRAIRKNEMKERALSERGKVPADMTGAAERGIYEISAELVGKVSNARWRRGEAPSKTLTRAINKKFIESDKKKEEPKKDVKEYWTPFLAPHHKHSARLSKEKSNKPDTIMDPGAGGTTHTTNEETKMDNKELINEALDCILEDNLPEMKDNLMKALQEKAMEKLEERKKEIAANYFAQ